jgi:hypothetical protein
VLEHGAHHIHARCFVDGFLGIDVQARAIGILQRHAVESLRSDDLVFRPVILVFTGHRLRGVHQDDDLALHEAAQHQFEDGAADDEHQDQQARVAQPGQTAATALGAIVGFALVAPPHAIGERGGQQQEQEDLERRLEIGKGDMPILNAAPLLGLHTEKF